jgi:hypothetical protein
MIHLELLCALITRHTLSITTSCKETSFNYFTPFQIPTIYQHLPPCVDANHQKHIVTNNNSFSILQKKSNGIQMGEHCGHGIDIDKLDLDGHNLNWM